MHLSEGMKEIEKTISAENMIALVDRELENTVLYIELLNNDIKKGDFTESMERLILANIKKIGLEFMKSILTKDSKRIINLILGHISVDMMKNITGGISDSEVDKASIEHNCDECDKKGSCIIEDAKNGLAEARGN